VLGSASAIRVFLDEKVYTPKVQASMAVSTTPLNVMQPIVYAQLWRTWYAWAQRHRPSVIKQAGRVVTWSASVDEKIPWSKGEKSIQQWFARDIGKYEHRLFLHPFRPHALL
jgi:hypothetical protein